MKEKIIDKTNSKCTGCHACYSICPKDAISMVENSEGFQEPKIDKVKCINCNLCSNICPVNNIDSNNNFNKPKIYASWSLDKENKKTSSSGGCFYEYAKYIISTGGIVIGAGFDDDFNVIHKAVEKIEDIELLKGSKYVQSKIDNMYKKTKTYLDKKIKVLFVGTPCQIAGLYAFLNNKVYNELYTLDLICHGVPTPKLYRKYLNEIKEEKKSDIKSVSFRNKDKGWKKFSMKVQLESYTYRKTLNKDSYMRLFLNNICLRESCYECEFSKIPRQADITLGDYWGIGDKYDDLDDDTGVSEIVINSNKGEELNAMIRNNIFMKETEFKYGIKVNPCLVGSVSKSINRENFFEELELLSCKQLVNKYCPKTKLLKRICYRIKLVLKKLLT